MTIVTYAAIESVSQKLDNVQREKLGLPDDVNGLLSFALAVRVGSERDVAEMSIRVAQ